MAVSATVCALLYLISIFREISPLQVPTKQNHASTGIGHILSNSSLAVDLVYLLSTEEVRKVVEPGEHSLLKIFQ